MENKILLTGIGGVVLGFIIGALCFGAFGVGNRYIRDNNRYQGGYTMNNGTTMDDTMHGMMSGLEGKTGDAFDREFLTEMIVHHKGAVEMAQMVLVTSKRPELIKLANDIISAQNKEILMMQEWKNVWFK